MCSENLLVSLFLKTKLCPNNSITDLFRFQQMMTNPSLESLQWKTCQPRCVRDKFFNKFYVIYDNTSPEFQMKRHLLVLYPEMSMNYSERFSVLFSADWTLHRKSHWLCGDRHLWRGEGGGGPLHRSQHHLTFRLQSGVRTQPTVHCTHLRRWLRFLQKYLLRSE